MKKYAFWNNKGGVGKTFLAFMVATEYARLHPEENVVVIDMCPQANISEMLLGGNGVGSANIDAINQRWESRRTIGGYFDKRLSDPDKPTLNEADYITRVKEYAPAIPSNVYLVCGDRSLELQVQAINQLASVSLPELRWSNVHSWLKDLQKGIESRFNNQVVFFMDCNPSFATYTAQALLAANRLIVPCTADGSSARAFENIGQLLYGIDMPHMYKGTAFSAKLAANNLKAPIIHLIVKNRSTIYGKDENDRSVPASAFKAMYKNIVDKALALKAKDRDLFTPNIETFVDMPDVHTISIVSSHLALPFHALEAKQYVLNAYDATKTKINPTQLDKYREALDILVASL